MQPTPDATIPLPPCHCVSALVNHGKHICLSQLLTPTGPMGQGGTPFPGLYLHPEEEPASAQTPRIRRGGSKLGWCVH